MDAHDNIQNSSILESSDVITVNRKCDTPFLHYDCIVTILTCVSIDDLVYYYIYFPYLRRMLKEDRYLIIQLFKLNKYTTKDEMNFYELVFVYYLHDPTKRHLLTLSNGMILKIAVENQYISVVRSVLSQSNKMHFIGYECEIFSKVCITAGKMGNVEVTDQIAEYVNKLDENDEHGYQYDLINSLAKHRHDVLVYKYATPLYTRFRVTVDEMAMNGWIASGMFKEFKSTNTEITLFYARRAAYAKNDCVVNTIIGLSNCDINVVRKVIIGYIEGGYIDDALNLQRQYDPESGLSDIIRNIYSNPHFCLNDCKPKMVNYLIDLLELTETDIRCYLENWTSVKTGLLVVARYPTLWINFLNELVCENDLAALIYLITTYDPHFTVMREKYHDLAANPKCNQCFIRWLKLRLF